MATGPIPGTVHSINASAGGVPKRAQASAEVQADGLTSDTQAHPRFHGGPDRAVCLLGLDVIERLRAQGHPIAPGTTGENLTLAGIPWHQVVPGARFTFAGGVDLEVVSYASPCNAIRASFADGDVRRLSAEDHPGQARAYARVLTPGTLRRGEACALHLAPEVRGEPPA